MKKIIILLSVVLFFIGCSTNNNGTVTVIPIAPTNLAGTVISTTQVNLSWIDNATNEDGFKVERKTGNGNYAVIGSMGANLSTYSDLGLTTNTTYTYRVYAHNSAGNSLQYSNELTLTTQDSIPSWLTNGLVGYWPFNGNANDESGNGNDGTVNGATLTTDRFGNNDKAYRFDNNTISVPHNSNLSISQNGQQSVSIWSYVTGAQTLQHLIGKRGDGANSFNWQIAFNYGANQGLLYSGGIINIGNTGVVSTYQLPLTQWTNIIGTYNSGTWSLYINGVLAATTNSTNFYDDVACNLAIGNSGAWGAFYGKLDDIRIYNRALSQSEVTYLATH
jgi:hypothetical protein